jgi:hypothetical protein
MTWTERWNMLRVIGAMIPFIIIGAYILFWSGLNIYVWILKKKEKHGK